jgi:hypothetical protein
MLFSSNFVFITFVIVPNNNPKISMISDFKIKSVSLFRPRSPSTMTTSAPAPRRRSGWCPRASAGPTFSAARDLPITFALKAAGLHPGHSKMDKT